MSKTTNMTATPQEPWWKTTKSPSAEQLKNILWCGVIGCCQAAVLTKMEFFSGIAPDQIAEGLNLSVGIGAGVLTTALLDGYNNYKISDLFKRIAVAVLPERFSSEPSNEERPLASDVQQFLNTQLVLAKQRHEILSDVVGYTDNTPNIQTTPRNEALDVFAKLNPSEVQRNVYACYIPGLPVAPIEYRDLYTNETYKVNAITPDINEIRILKKQYDCSSDTHQFSGLLITSKTAALNISNPLLYLNQFLKDNEPFLLT